MACRRGAIRITLYVGGLISFSTLHNLAPGTSPPPAVRVTESESKSESGRAT